MQQIGLLSFKTMTKNDKMCLLTLIAVPTLAALFIMPYSNHRSFLEALKDGGVWMGWLLLSILTHEGLHGLFFWFYGGKVRFGVVWRTKLGPTPYATAPGQMFSKRQMQLVALAPQLMTIALLIASFFTSWETAQLMQVVALCNLGGGGMDLFSCMWLESLPANIRVEDCKSEMKVFEGGAVDDEVQ